MEFRKQLMEREESFEVQNMLSLHTKATVCCNDAITSKKKIDTADDKIRSL